MQINIETLNFLKRITIKQVFYSISNNNLFKLFIKIVT